MAESMGTPTEVVVESGAFSGLMASAMSPSELVEDVPSTQLAATPQIAISVRSPNDDLKVALTVIVRAADTMQAAHWNLRSSNFIALHPWFGEKYDELFDIADGIAEQIKIRNIDEPVSISRQEVLVTSDEQALLSNIRMQLGVTAMALMSASKNPAMDAPTKNLLEGWQGDVEKMKWFVTSSIK